MRVGVISDTHGLLRPEALAALHGVDHLIHAGDIGDPGILDDLRALAPLTAIRGNIDRSGPCAALPPTEAVELGGHLIYVVHALPDLDISPRAAGVGAVIYGHSHKPAIDRKDGVLYLNPGSAGLRRFSLPLTVALLEISMDAMDAIDAVIIPLTVEPPPRAA